MEVVKVGMEGSIEESKFIFGSKLLMTHNRFKSLHQNQVLLVRLKSKAFKIEHIQGLASSTRPHTLFLSSKNNRGWYVVNAPLSLLEEIQQK